MFVRLLPANMATPPERGKSGERQRADSGGGVFVRLCRQTLTAEKTIFILCLEKRYEKKSLS
ncbi:hypothetical protein [uncultured Mailhella sp.]|uniref:hypothetical protein n=1 Tax=uncultured Mailhella sp. TaxID=1981031 RepID=UPI002607E3A3|nr:hypothetical protein [uncultured Mailhella sp.]